MVTEGHLIELLKLEVAFDIIIEDVTAHLEGKSIFNPSYIKQL